MEYHLRITPRGLDLPSWEVISDALECQRIAVHLEGEDEGLHYHIYLVTQVAIKTLRNRILSNCKFPAGKRGEENAYYMLKHISPTSKDRPRLEYQKFTLGYTAKLADKQYSKEYTDDELESARDYYWAYRVPGSEIPTTRQPVEAQASPLAPRLAPIFGPPQAAPVGSQSEPEEKVRETKTEQQYERYKEYVTERMEKTDYHVAVPVKAIKYWSIRFFESECASGLLPQKAHINRFVASYVWGFMRKKQTITSAEMTEELISLGYV